MIIIYSQLYDNMEDHNILRSYDKYIIMIIIYSDLYDNMEDHNILRSYDIYI